MFIFRGGGQAPETLGRQLPPLSLGQRESSAEREIGSSHSDERTAAFLCCVELGFVFFS